MKESVFQYCRSLTIYILRIVIERGVDKATHEFVRNLGNELALGSRRDNFSVKGGENTVWWLERSLLIWWLKDEGILIWWILVFQ